MVGLKRKAAGGPLADSERSRQKPAGHTPQTNNAAAIDLGPPASQFSFYYQPSVLKHLDEADLSPLEKKAVHILLKKETEPNFTRTRVWKALGRADTATSRNGNGASHAKKEEAENNDEPQANTDTTKHHRLFDLIIARAIALAGRNSHSSVVFEYFPDLQATDWRVAGKLRVDDSPPLMHPPREQVDEKKAYQDMLTREYRDVRKLLVSPAQPKAEKEARNEEQAPLRAEDDQAGAQGQESGQNNGEARASSGKVTLVENLRGLADDRKTPGAGKGDLEMSPSRPSPEDASKAAPDINFASPATSSNVPDQAPRNAPVEVAEYLRTATLPQLQEIWDWEAKLLSAGQKWMVAKVKADEAQRAANAERDDALWAWQQVQVDAQAVRCGAEAPLRGGLEGAIRELEEGPRVSEEGPKRRAKMERELAAKKAELAARDEELKVRDKELAAKSTELAATKAEIAAMRSKEEKRRDELKRFLE